jgi:hypothetical protein
MGVAVTRLTDRVNATNTQDISWGELLPLQIEAANERLQERVGNIKLLATSGIKAVRELADLIPLLFVRMSYMITVGQVSKIVMLRRSIAEGTARPNDVAAFEATSALRAKAIESAIQSTAAAIVASRAEGVQAMGYSGKDFHPKMHLLRPVD